MDSDSVADKGFYTRRDILRRVSGAMPARSSFPGRETVRRIWPDEPNVGFVSDQMAFLVDGAVRIGGPTLKTYDLNNAGTAGTIRETRLYHDDRYGKLRGSEVAGTEIDVFNAVGSWGSETSPAVASAISWETELVSDSSTYSFATNMVSILRPGVYRIAYRVYAVTLIGVLQVTLGVGGLSWEWKGLGLPTTLTLSDSVLYVKADTKTDTVSVTLTAGTSIGAAGALKSVLTILKMR